MCGRFSLQTVTQVLLDRFQVGTDEPLRPRYNIAPGQDSPLILRERPGVFTVARWGLIPSWAKDEKIGYKTINARSETLEEKPAFRHAFAKNRCLVIADGFYEWRKSNAEPYRFILKGGKPFAFAGLYEHWTNEKGEDILSFSIITVPPNEKVNEVHPRMPAILLPEHERQWLSDISLGDLKKLLYPYPSSEMQSYRVSAFVNKPENDSPEVIQPLASRQSTLL